MNKDIVKVEIERTQTIKDGKPFDDFLFVRGLDDRGWSQVSFTLSTGSLPSLLLALSQKVEEITKSELALIENAK